MINLLPEQDKKLARREYRLRVAVTALAALFFCAVVASAALFPAYILGVTRERALRQEVVTETERTFAEAGVDINAAASATNRQTALLEEEAYPAIVDARFMPVLEQKSKGIRLTGLSYAEQEEGALLRVEGVATSRASLTSYIERLKGVEGFSSVSAPLSSFVQDRDLDFAISISL